jgi:hypothetical protein
VWTEFRVASGLPYALTGNTGAGSVAPGFGYDPFFEPMADATTPAIKELDLRVSKAIRVGGLTWSVFGDFRNLFGFTNTLRVFAETGTTTNDLHRERLEAGEIARLQQEAGGYLTTVTKNGETLMAADLRSGCDTWPGGPVNCVLLRKAEARWGDGDGLYDEAEWQAAFGALYELFYGPWAFRGPPRHVRLGVEIRF